MNDILTDEAKSFKLIRPKFKTGDYKPIVSRLKKLDNCLFLPLVRTENEIFESLNNLFGPMGTQKAFTRYYFPKRFIFTSALYLKPKVIESIDKDKKRKLVSSKIVGFRGIPNDKLIDRRNTIIDFTDIMDLVVPTDKQYMVKPGVVDYVEQILPEFMCYTLFKNTKHDKNNDKDEESTEIYAGDPEGDPEVPLLKPFIEQSDEEFSHSIEEFTEKLFSKTKIFAMTGPAIGISEYGFDKFIVSFPITLTNKSLIKKDLIKGKLPLLRNIRINPDLIYQLSFIRFIYKVYEAYYNGGGSTEFINEAIKYNLVFHLYANNGTGFCINLKELKNNMNFKPERVAMMLMNRLTLMCMINTGTVTDTDLDILDDESEEKEYNLVTSMVKKDTEVKDEFKEDIKTILNEDLAIKTIVESKKLDKNVSIIEEKDIENPSHFIPTSENIFESKSALNKLNELATKFSSNTNISIIKNENEGEEPIEFDDKELSEILEENDSNDDETIIEEEEPEEDIIEEVIEEQEDTQQKEEDFIEAFEKNYTNTDDDSVEPISLEDDYTILKPTKKGPIKLAHVTKKEKVLSKAELKRIEILKNKYKSIKIDETPIAQIIGNSSNIEIEDYNKIGTKRPKTPDENVFKLSINNFQKSYVKKNYQSDIINSVRTLSLNKERPLYITKANVNDTSDQFNDKLTYEFTLEDEFKKKHNLKFDVPKIDENGMIKIQGTQKYLKNQLIRNPIVKIGRDKVYITTQLNSYLVMRTGLILNKSSEVIRRLLNEYYIDNENVHIERGNCEKDNVEYLTTLEYDSLAKNFFRIKLNDETSKYGEHIEVYFSQKIIRDKIKKHNIRTGFEDLEELPSNILPIAINYTKKIAYSIDINANSSANSLIISLFHETFKNDDNLISFIKNIKTPRRRVMSRVEIQSFKVPLIVFLNYTFGWERVKSYFKENEIEFSEKKIPNSTKLSVRFYDGYLYYNQFPLNGALLLNGLTEVNTEDYLYESLTNQALYTNFVQQKFKTRNVVKGWIDVRESMLDYKTLQILEALKLPTDLLEIFLYCNDLLTDNQVKDESDISNYRIRCNEIISECLYKVLKEQYTTFKKQSGKRVSMTIPQNAVMSKVYSTEILENYDSISPVGELRNLSLTTFKGPGGTKLDQAFTTKKRAFDDTYFGIFGISTPDNSNAGVVKELTLNPKITNTLGFIEQQDRKNYSLNDIATISEALTPFANNSDDPSRIAFISGQNNHVGGLIDSSLPCIRTGVEKVIHTQCGENFTRKAKYDGKIEDIDEFNKKIYIKYDNGKKEVFDYNNLMLKNSDAFNESFFNCFVKVGEKVKAGDLLAGDGRFFKKDPFSGDVVYTHSRMGLVAIHEGCYTEDDSDLLTESFCNNLKMNFSKRKQIAIKPQDAIIDYKKIGDYVKLGDPIFTFDNSGAFEDEYDENSDDDLISALYSTMDKESVSEMIHQTPKANLTGTIKDIKVYWTVPINKMSKSVAKFVNEYIKSIKKQIIDEEKFTGKPSKLRPLIEMTEIDKNSGGDPRINGAIVDRDGAILIEYMISNDDLMSTGDKITLNSSLKTVNGTVVPKHLEPYTQDGYKLDGIFSWISSEARMVKSLWYNFIGTILYKFSKRWAIDFLTEIGEEVPKNERMIKI